MPVLAFPPLLPPPPHTHTWDFGPVSTVPENVALDKFNERTKGVGEGVGDGWGTESDGGGGGEWE